MKYPYQQTYLKIIGQKISETRHTRGEKLSTVAKAIGVSNKVISQIENGHYLCLKLQTLKSLTEYLEINIADLLSENS